MDLSQFGDRQRDVQIVVAETSKLTRRRLRTTEESHTTIGYVEAMSRSRDLLNIVNTVDAVTAGMLMEIMECHGRFCMSFGKNATVWQPQLRNHHCEHTCSFYNHPGTSVYLCRASGNLHVCTVDLCDRRIETREREREFCDLTGLCYPLSEICYAVPVSRIGGVGSLDDPTNLVTSEVREQHKRKQQATAEHRQEQRKEDDMKILAGDSAQTMSMLKILDYMSQHQGKLNRIPTNLFPGQVENADLDTGDSSGSSPVRTKRLSDTKRKTPAKKRKKAVVVVRRSKHTEMILESSAMDRLDVYHTVLTAMTAHKPLDIESRNLLCEIVESLWALIITPREFNLCNNAYHLNAHVVSILYRTWFGLKFGKWIIVPELRWVSDHLPDRRKLPRCLKLKPKAITATDKFFNAVLEHCSTDNLRICHEEIQDSLARWRTLKGHRA